MNEGEEDIADSVAAWYDDDDESLSISLATSNRLRKLRKAEDEDIVNGRIYTRRLRQQFERIYPVPDWAKDLSGKRRRNSQSDDDEDISPADPLSALFQSSRPLTQRPTTFLPSDFLAITPLAAIPQPHNHSAPLTLHFHPSHPLVVIGYQDRTLRVHSIDGKYNPLATSLRFPRLPIHSALFHPSKNLIYVTGRRRRGVFIWDLNSGKVRKISKTFDEESMSSGEWSNPKTSPNGTMLGIVGAVGWLCLLSAETGQYLGGIKIDGTIADYTFAHGGRKAIIVSVSGEIWECSTDEMVVINRWRDEGGVSLTKVALSSNDRFLAIGSTSGIVTVYDVSSNEHTLVKTLYNLTTPITQLTFSPDGQLLVMASSGKKDQLRVVHVPEFTVFPNWPTSKTPLGVIDCLDVGETGYLAVGRKKGVALWKFRDL